MWHFKDENQNVSFNLEILGTYIDRSKNKRIIILVSTKPNIWKGKVLKWEIKDQEHNFFEMGIKINNRSPRDNSGLYWPSKLLDGSWEVIPRNTLRNFIVDKNFLYMSGTKPVNNNKGIQMS